MPIKSESDVIFCLQLIGQTLICTLHLSKHKSIDHLCINPILWIGSYPTDRINTQVIYRLQVPDNFVNKT